VKLHLSKFAGLNAFSGYGESHVLINGERHTHSLVVMPEALHEWLPPFLEGAALDALLDLPVEILLLGTGRRLSFPAPEILARFSQRRLGIEVMDTPAACRTYNILLAEGRKVAAAIRIEPGGAP